MFLLSHLAKVERGLFDTDEFMINQENWHQHNLLIFKYYLCICSAQTDAQNISETPSLGWVSVTPLTG